MIDGYPSVFAIGNSGSSTIMVSPAGATYRLFNNGVEIGREYVSSTCIQGTTWWGRCTESEIISNISILFPENNKVYKAGRDINLKWNSVNPYFGNIKIKISKDGVLVKEITTVDDQQETIVIPITAPAGQYKLEIGYDSQTKAVEYTSSVNFSVNNNVFTQKLGMGYITTGGEVVALQTILKDEGYLNTIDGKFGRETRAAVIAFQTTNGLEADGIIGEATRTVLNTKWGARDSSWN
jgi:hypothetical protein